MAAFWARNPDYSDFVMHALYWIWTDLKKQNKESTHIEISIWYLARIARISKSCSAKVATLYMIIKHERGVCILTLKLHPNWRIGDNEFKYITAVLHIHLCFSKSLFTLLCLLLLRIFLTSGLTVIFFVKLHFYKIMLVSL